MAASRFDWVELLLPVQFLRALWDALFPSRFERVVLDGLDGSPRPGYARPITFCLGCWLLLAASIQAFPWAFRTTGVAAILTSLPPNDRRQVASRLGITSVAGVRIDTGSVLLGPHKFNALAAANKTLGKRFGRITPNDVASYFEEHGDSALGLRVRGYASRADDRPAPFSEAALVLLVVFGFVPAWYVSYRVLASPERTAAETRRVHMYNDGLLVITVLIPFSLATYSGQAFGSPWPQRALAAIALADLGVWTVRTTRLFRLTHRARAWRTAAAHIGALGVALVMFVVFASLVAIATAARLRAGL